MSDLTEFKLMGEKGKVVKKDDFFNSWVLYYNGEIVRYLDKYECNFIDSAIEAVKNKQ